MFFLCLNAETGDLYLLRREGITLPFERIPNLAVISGLISSQDECRFPVRKGLSKDQVALITCVLHIQVVEVVTKQYPMVLSHLQLQQLVHSQMKLLRVLEQMAVVLPREQGHEPGGSLDLVVLPIRRTHVPGEIPADEDAPLVDVVQP